MSKKYVLIESKGYSCVHRSDPVVNDPNLVTIGQSVRFNYGTREYIGEIVNMLDHEKELLDQLKLMKRALKRKRQDSSFHDEVPRKAALRSRELVGKIMAKSTKSPGVSEAKAAMIKKQKKAREDCEILTEAALTDGEGDWSANLSSENDSSDKESISSESSQSSIENLGAPHVKNSPKAEDIKKLRTALVGSREDGEDEDQELNKSAGADALIPGASRQSATLPASDTSLKSPSKIGIPGASRQFATLPASDTSQKSPSKIDASQATDTSGSGHQIQSEVSTTNDKRKDNHAKRKEKKRKVRRNDTIFEGQNYLHSSEDEGVVQLFPPFKVYVKEVELEEALMSKSVTIFVRRMVDKIYARQAILNSTPQGFPPRGKGKKFYKGKGVPPRIHPEGLKALIRKAVCAEADNKTWRPKTCEKSLKNVFGGRFCELKTHWADESSSDDSSGED